MEQTTTATASLQKGQCLTERQLNDMGITPTNIDCFQFSHFLLYAKDNQRVIVQPLPHNQYKVIRVYDYIESNSAIWIG
ncbi:MAG: hypothetical protein HC896_09895 [Bacteroidales bacterium]|nr:hypothetical protein [Bacteroidales bacterium]